MRFRPFRPWIIVVPAALAAGAGGYRLMAQKMESPDKGRAGSIAENSSLSGNPDSVRTEDAPLQWHPVSILEKSQPKERDIKPVAPPKEGDPWKFYAEGDWKNAAYNFGLARARTRNDSGNGPLEMGRGVAAFKAAMADENHFDSVMMEAAVEAFGAALATDDASLRENAHYNLANAIFVGSSRVDLQACKLEYSIVSPK